MRQVLGSSAGILIARMPRPIVEPGSVLVRVRYSFVSPGTEVAPYRTAKVQAPDSSPAAVTTEPAKPERLLSRANFQRALHNPRAAIDFAVRLAKDKMSMAIPNKPSEHKNEDDGPAVTSNDLADQGWNLGYSAAGEVVGVGPGITDLRPGDLVACAGAGQANHAD